MHYGRAVFEEKDLFGDVVNTAARIESLAEGGEIFVSSAVVDHVTNFPFPLTSLGPEVIMGREQTVDIYAVDWQKLGEKELITSWENRHIIDSSLQDITKDENHSQLR